MTETFKCPSCSAPLDFEGQPMQKCRFCGSNVIVPTSAIRQSSFFGGFGNVDFSNLSDLTGKALRIAEIQSLIQQRKKIEAIKLFRETFGTGLAESKDAVERMERGESIDISGIGVRTSQPRNSISVDPKVAKMLGLSVGGSIIGMVVISMIVIAVIGGVILFTMYRVTADPASPISPSRATPELPKTVSNEKKPSIATEIFKVGGEGTGAGKFNDNRTIAVDPEGRIFSADFQGGRIQVLDASGGFVQQLTSDIKRTVDALTVDRKGTLFVLQGYDLIRVDVAQNSELGRTRIDGAVDVAIALDGKIFVATRRKGVTVLNPDGSVARIITFPKELGLDLPNQIAVDGAGTLFIHDDRTGAIFKLKADGTLLGRFGGRGSAAAKSSAQPQFSSVNDLAVDSVGRLYVVETSRISIVEADGAAVQEFETSQAFGIAINDRDEVFVASRPYVVKYGINLSK